MLFVFVGCSGVLGFRSFRSLCEALVLGFFGVFGLRVVGCRC